MAKTFKIGGVHPAENKFSAGKAIERLPLPTTVIIPVAQHLGAPATPVVKKGDQVKAGQVVAQSAGFVSANIHSSVSGTVKKVDAVIDGSGYKVNSIIIDVEGDEWVEGVDLGDELIEDINLDAKTIIDKIAAAGIVGLGGATFPTHVKLSIPQGMKAEMLLINAVECEPYLTADHQLMLEKGPEIMVGTQLLMKAMGVEKAVIGIEKNKPDAIKHLTGLATQYDGIEVCSLKVKYPQGGEKQLIKAVTGKEVPSGGLPIAVGCVVNNVGTAFAAYEAVMKNKPLVERVVTVTGKSVKRPSNFMVRVGAPTAQLIEAAGGLPEDTGKIVSGGPMMGRTLTSQDIAVTKGTSGILIMREKETVREPMQNCIRCSKCISVCAMGLEPYLLMTYAERKLWEESEKAHVMDCIECGSCSYTCPSARPLLDYIRLGKGAVGQIIRNRKN